MERRAEDKVEALSASVRLLQELTAEQGEMIRELTRENNMLKAVRREKLAGRAMQGELAAQSEEDGTWDQDWPKPLAERCVAFADALIEELGKGEDDG